ncbi:MAG: NAD-dependent epimerase/dehydratase family protein, partial [FCB group bacterium]|nr:NAD-dependent epimerase/dehydratase family protein [FCB group bacterium]
MNRNDKIFVAGRHGMVGGAIARRLEAQGFSRLVGPPSSELDLQDQQAVAAFFEAERPDFVFLAAARVGGIYANNT